MPMLAHAGEELEAYEAERAKLEGAAADSAGGGQALDGVRGVPLLLALPAGGQAGRHGPRPC
jgi:hypothetical protein